MGSKAKLLPFIKKVVKDNCKHVKSVLDIFAGTGNVAYAFNNKTTRVLTNDLLFSNYISHKAWFSDGDYDNKKLETLIDFYNASVITDDNYVSDCFSNTYFSAANCRKIGFIRQDIANKAAGGVITEREEAILITSLLYAMDRIANTVGHYDAYRMNGDLDKPLLLQPLDLPKPGINSNNQIYRQDANHLARMISADLVYIDPPYNSRQYCDAYHLLENVAEWKKPKVFGVAKKMERGAELKSKYCTQKAPLAFDDLIQHLNCRYILVSYNNTGTTGAGRSQAKISDDEIIASLSKRGRVLVFSTEYKQFTTGKTAVVDHQERLFLCLVGETGRDTANSNSGNRGFAKSPLNYTGGKFRLLDQLSEKFPNQFDTFFDVFAGGYNVGANLGGPKCVCNDKQKEVISILKLLRKYEPYDLEKRIEFFVDEYGLSNTALNGYEFYGCDSSRGVGPYNKCHYEKLREKYNSFSDESEEKYFCLLTLIIFSFNNQIRFNSKGEFNMPVGKRDFNNSIRKNLKGFCEKMRKQEITFFSLDFKDLEEKIGQNDFVYCDPPYFLGTAAYNEGNGWTIHDETALLDFLTRIDKKGIRFALSNVIEHKGRKHQQLIDWAIHNQLNINYFKADYSNSNYQLKSKTDKTTEVLITNF